MIYQRVTLRFSFDGPINEVPDIFIYVTRGNKNISYLRITDPSLLSSKPFYRDTRLKIEKGQNPKGNYFEAGILNMRIAFKTEAEWATLRTSPVPEDPQFKGSNFKVPWSEEPSKPSRSNMKPIAIIANVYMAKNLISADDTGLSDPLIVFDHHGAQAKTSVYKQTLNPIWNERVLINSFIYGNYIPSLILKVYDLDENVITADDYECLGYDLVRMNEDMLLSQRDANKIQQMRWYSIRDDNNNISGSILMSLTVLVLESNLDIYSIHHMNFPKEKYILKLSIVGLRDLQSSGIFRVRNPYIRFHIGSVKNGETSRGGSGYDILTARCKKGGSNASFSDIITLESDLPLDINMLPTITCLVYDSSSLLGVFNIDVSSSYAENLYFIHDKLKEIRNGVDNVTYSTAIDRLLVEYSAELQQVISYADTEQFKRRAFKNAGNDHYLASNSITNIFQSNLGFSSQPLQYQQSSTGNPRGRRPAESSEPKDPVVIKPKYNRGANGEDILERELEIPSRGKYERIGYDTIKKKNRQYRLIVNKPLENTEYILESIFSTIPITRGKQLKVDETIWEKLLHSKHDFKSVGRYKGRMEIFKKKVLEDLKNIGNLDLLRQYDIPIYNNEEKTIEITKKDKEMIKENNVRVRLYLIEAEIFDEYDIGKEPDVYTKIYIGEKLLFNNRDKKIESRRNPKFFQSYEFKTVLPGEGMLKIEFYDWDRILKDDYIGSTEVDLEDRYYDKRWGGTAEHPIEKRDIKENSLGAGKGTVKLWIEIDNMTDTERMKRAMQDISPLPAKEFELRVVVWEADDVPIDDLGELSDAYIRCTFPSLNLASNTDTHWRSTGFASFNWRLKYNLKSDNYIDEQAYGMEVQVWDKDVITPNDYLCSYRFRPAVIYSLILQCIGNDKSAKFKLPDDTRKDGKFEVVCEKNPKRKNSRNTKIILSIECLTLEE